MLQAKTFNENETEKSPRTEWISIKADEANYSYANYGVLIYKNERLFLFCFFKHHHIGKTAWVICRIFLQRETWVIIFENTEIYQTKITFIFWCLDCWMDKLARFKKSSWPLGDCNEHIWGDTTIWLMKGGNWSFWMQI